VLANRELMWLNHTDGFLWLANVAEYKRSDKSLFQFFIEFCG